jgi:drug/metabolite transporter (DMT)-like permease
MLHFTGLEPQLPFASFKQLGVLTINSFLGTIFADSLWLYATIKTGALTSTLSGSLAIPLFILFDTYWRHQPLNTWQLLSSIPIMVGS